MSLGRDLNSEGMSYNLPLRCYFADFIAALPRPATTAHSICFGLYVVCGYNLCSEVRSGGWSREERFGGGGKRAEKKFLYIFFKKMRKSVAFYIFLWYYVSEEAYRRLLPSRQRTAEVGY